MSKRNKTQTQRARQDDGFDGASAPCLQTVEGGGKRHTTVKHFDGREERLFRSLDLDNDQQVLASDFEQRLNQAGLSADDTRLKDSFAKLDLFRDANKTSSEINDLSPIPKAHFCAAVRRNILLIERALQGNMIIADFPDFCDGIERIHSQTSANKSGRPADYIPQLDLKGPAADQYGAALCTVDGQRFDVGDSHVYFSIQSTCKPINYCLALEEHGHEFVHRYVGHEPSGASFNELTLDKFNRPHNPMINAGAIMSSALIELSGRNASKRNSSGKRKSEHGAASSRFELVVETWRKLCGGAKPRFSTPVYLSERETADRNFALGYYMREKGAFPEGANLHDALDFYFQCCSLEVTCNTMSVVAATLANGGICPATGERVFETETVQNCLSLMSSCGMYDYSGEFAFTIGLPAKSGVSGAIMIVVPNVMGLCVWSPRLDAYGNSIRGIEFCRELVRTFSFHNYDILTSTETGKLDPRVHPIERKASRVNNLVWAASKGDLGAIQDLLMRGAQLDAADYDLRTSLHLAAAENQAEIVRFMIDAKRRHDIDTDLNPRDRWGGTPLDDAYLHGNADIIDMLKNAGGKRGAISSRPRGNLELLTGREQVEAQTTAELIWAASEGDLVSIYRLVARGVPLGAADYDFRTPLHLAAAEGHLNVVTYFLAQKVHLNPLDRWGNTPLDDASRHGRKEVAALLKRSGGVRGANLDSRFDSRKDGKVPA